MPTGRVPNRAADELMKVFWLPEGAGSAFSLENNILS
jgi:hypothetical protein